MPLMNASVGASIDAGAPSLRIGWQAVSASDIQRSALLQEIAQLDGETELSIFKDAFTLWQAFQASVPASPEGLASVLQVGSRTLHNTETSAHTLCCRLKLPGTTPASHRGSFRGQRLHGVHCNCLLGPSTWSTQHC